MERILVRVYVCYWEGSLRMSRSILVWDAVLQRNNDMWSRNKKKIWTPPILNGRVALAILFGSDAIYRRL